MNKISFHPRRVAADSAGGMSILLGPVTLNTMSPTNINP